MKIRSDTAVRVGFSLALLILAAIGILSYQSTQGLIRASTMAIHSHDVIEVLDDLHHLLTETESASRAFLISGNEADRESYRQSPEKANKLIADLEHLTVDNPPQQERIRALKKPVMEKLVVLRERDELRASGSYQAALRLFQSGRGQQLMRLIVARLYEIERDENQLLRQRTSLAREDAEASTLMLILGSLLSFGILASIFYKLSREISRRAKSEERLTHINRLYALLSQTNQAIVRIRDREKLFQEVCRIAVEYGKLRMAWIGVVDRDSRAVDLAAFWGHEEGYLEDIHISVADEPDGRGPTGSALREGRHFVCRDIGSDPRVIPWREEALKRGYRSSAAFPIKVRNEVVGAFTVYAAELGFFDEEIVTLLDEVTSDLSFALENMEEEARRKHVEEMLRQQAEILDQVHDSVVSTDLDGYVKSWNRGAERLFGYTAEEAIGRHISFVYPKDKIESLQNDVIKPLKEKGIHETEVQMQTHSGKEFYAHLSLSLLRNGQGVVTGMVGYSIDVTERRRAEEQVRELNRDLERRILGRTQELAELNKQLAMRNEELARASRMKSDFLAGMSHELRTPMNAITGFSDLLAEEGAGPLNEKQKRFVDHIQKGSRHLLELINEVLDLSKIEAGRIELQYETFPAAGALSEVLATTDPLATAKNIQVESRVDPELKIYADRVRFKQILFNLLSNALKFTPEGGRVWIEATSGSGEVSLSVSDNGMGIAHDEHDAVFEEFHQVGATTKGVKEGTGLGLAITKRLVGKHGGRIFLASEPGKGSRFTFTLPAQTGNSERVATVEA